MDRSVGQRWVDVLGGWMLGWVGLGSVSIDRRNPSRAVSANACTRS